MEKLTAILAIVEDFERGVTTLDKAVTLARKFHAQVDLLITDPAYAGAFVPRCRALGYEEVTLTSVPRGDEPLDSLILRRVQERRPDLVIKSRSGAHPLRRWTLDANDWHLANECPVPVLLVGAKPWGNPPRFAAAVDVSAPDTQDLARSILHTAGYLALGSRGRLDILYSEREEHDETLRMERAVKLAQMVREFHVGCERLQLFSGPPEHRLPPLIAQRQYDVLVLGAVSHRGGLGASFDPLSGKLADASGSDVVLVKAAAANAASLRQQHLHEGEQFV